MNKYDRSPSENFIPNEVLIEHCNVDAELNSSLKHGNSFAKIKDDIVLKDDYYYIDNLFFDSITTQYRINKNLYRTNNFKPIHDDDYVLFSGCSFTFGQGLPEDLIWANILLNKMQKHKDKSFNLAQNGASIHYVIKEVMLFIRKYGKPKQIFLLLPEISRDLIYRNFSKTNIFEIHNVLYRSEYLEHDEENAKKYIINYVHENNLLRCSTMIAMLEDFCKESGIKLLWSTTMKNDYNTLKFFNFKYMANSFIDFADVYRDNAKKIENVNNLPLWDLAADGQHPGTAYHYLLAESFFKEINENN